MEHNQPILHAVDVSKSYRIGQSSVPVLAGLNLTLGTGDFTAVMGPSGSGKTTLLHLLAGLLTPDSGCITIRERVITGMRDAEMTRFRRRHVGLIFQDYNLMPTLSVEENMELPLRLDGRRPAQENVRALLHELRLEPRRTHRPSELSGGERQRVAIGRALLAHPDLILADEPTGNLDSLAGRDFCDMLAHVNREHQSTILLVTHDPAVAACAKRVHILIDGRIGDTLEVASRHDAERIAHRYLELMEQRPAGVPA